MPKYDKPVPSQPSHAPAQVNQREANRVADAERAEKIHQKKVNEERGGASNVKPEPEVSPTPVNNPAPGDTDPIYPGQGPGSPSNPTSSLGVAQGKDEWPSNPSLLGPTKADTATRADTNRDEIRKNDL